MTKFIIVCGLTAAGKTTISDSLAKKLNIVCLHKDSIKESLYDIQSLKTLEDSRKIGHDSIQLLFKLVEEQLKNGVDVIMEGVFRHLEDVVLFKKWQKEYDLEVCTVVVEIDEDERNRRFLERNKVRHLAHHDGGRVLNDGDIPFDYDKMPGEKINIVTDKLVEENIKIVLDKIN